MLTEAFELAILTRLGQAAKDMGVDSLKIEDICNSEFKENFAFIDPEEFKKDIYEAFGVNYDENRCSNR